MFNDIGGKIKGLAQAVCWIGIIISIIIGIVPITGSNSSGGRITGLLIIGIGAIVSWIGSFCLYGFGQLVENSDKLVDVLSHDPNLANDMGINRESRISTSVGSFDGEIHDDSVRCPHCKRKIIVPEGTISANCPWCNKKISF